MNVGWPEIILIVFVLLLLFGARRIPDIAHGLGKGIKEFKKALKDTEDEVKTGINEPDKKRPGSSNNRQDG
jgi:sec-independent protein translocase protein TatA